MSACPCGSGKPYEICCGRWHTGEAAPDAEALMRSRYVAFVLGNADYLAATWHPDSRPEALDLDETPKPQWIGLKVVSHARQDDDHATVEFIARYKINGRAHRLHERSRFERIDGRWFYLDGTMQE